MIRDLKIHMAQCGEDNIFEDNVMTVKYVPIYRKEQILYESSQEESEDEPSSELRNSVEVEAVVDQVNDNFRSRLNLVLLNGSTTSVYS